MSRNFRKTNEQDNFSINIQLLLLIGKLIIKANLFILLLSY